MRGFILDIQGTLIDDKDYKPIEGAVEFVDYLNKNSIPFIFLTNNTKRDSKEFIKYLKSLGFNFKHYLDPLMMLDDLIDKSVVAYGNKEFIEIVEKRFNINKNNPDYVIVGLKLYSCDEIAEIIEYVLNGAKLIGMHKTSLYHKNSKRYPGLGAILEMIKYSTNKDYIVLGKPSKLFFNKAKEILDLDFKDLTFISDDLIGDLLPAKELGIRSVLVLSGKIKSTKEFNVNEIEIYKSIKEFFEEIK